MQALRGKLSVSSLVLFLTLTLFLVSLLSLPSTPSYAAQSGEKIGIAIAVSGSVSASRGGNNVAIAVKDEVFLSDTLITGSDGKAQILLDDDSSITFGPNTNCELSEFANTGKSSRFGARLGHGVMRVITGAITESNPNGFKISTPLATVGIRGTIFTLEADDTHTTLRVANADRPVLINGIPVPESYKATVTLGTEQPVVVPMTQEDKDSDLDLSLPASEEKVVGEGESGKSEGSGSESSESSANTAEVPANSFGANNAAFTAEGLGSEALMTDITEHPIQIPVENIPIQIPVPFETASVSGNLSTGSASFFGSFGFKVDLQSGNITDGVMKGRDASVAIGTTQVFNFTGGTGTANASGFNITNFSGSGAVISPGTGGSTVTTPLDASASNISGASDLIAMPDGGTVPVNFEVYGRGGSSPEISGSGVGNLKR
ncbi:hypothetical protein FACS1894204_04270 [Synergistales bacterium]|nr:hypothetical protein FACS1894204_04270 [Synergistales bacterium]